MLAKKSTKSETRKKVIFYMGLFFMISGILVMISSFTLIEFQTMKISYTGPFGQFNIDSLTAEQEQRIFIGFVITSLGIVLIKIGI